MLSEISQTQKEKYCVISLTLCDFHLQVLSLTSKKVEFIKPDSKMVTARGWWPRMGVVVEWGDVGKMISLGL